MNLLLDTHTFLWQSFAPEKIPRAAMKAMSSAKANLYVSIASLWEIAILMSLGRVKLDMGLKPLVEVSARDAGILLFGIEPRYLEEVSTLVFFHRDPFDRMLIVQAKNLEAKIVGKDDAFDRYGIERIWN